MIEKLAMNSANTFLATFTTIEKWLRKTANADRFATFHQLVDRVAATNRAVLRYRNDLKEYADLRNAIIHERTDSHVIAEPNARAVADFERLCATLLVPPTVLPMFQRRVETLTTKDTVGAAVTIMGRGSFSQLPIVSDNTVEELLTAATVARWLASEVVNELVNPWETKIELALQYTEDQDHYCFLTRTATLFDALSKFDEFVERGKGLDAVLVTNDGRRNQKLLGILTIYDVPQILSATGLKRVPVE